MSFNVMETPAAGLLSFRLFEIGGTPVTLAGVTVALVIVVVSFALSRLSVRLLSRLRTRMGEGNAALYILEKFAGYGIAIFGIVFALSSMGLNLSSLAVFAGALGVGVGLGLQGVVKEFVSGIVLLFDRILNVGDYIELPGSGIRGVVYEIGARATRIRTNDNLDIFVPNSKLIEERFINWTLKGQTRRIHIPFSVAYGADKAKVREVILHAAKDVPFTLPDSGTRRTQVWMTSFGDSALNFELVVWPTLEAVKRPAAMQAAYTWAIDDALRAAAIEIPFPQRDIRVRSVFDREGEDAFHALGYRPKAAEPPEIHERRTRNDAAHDTLRPDDDPPPAAQRSETEEPP
ncbi:MAG TPA: mechanosensitive ion channel domain-containing protein [Rhizomicrobium sp.]|jgi:small-conductance mechanosensitive channel|nr:mechanosensitive ion channel domain-containing protein [Rhizomicrobium sp.]